MAEQTCAARRLRARVEGRCLVIVNLLKWLRVAECLQQGVGRWITDALVPAQQLPADGGGTQFRIAVQRAGAGADLGAAAPLSQLVPRLRRAFRWVGCRHTRLALLGKGQDGVEAFGRWAVGVIQSQQPHRIEVQAGCLGPVEYLDTAVFGLRLKQLGFGQLRESAHGFCRRQAGEVGRQPGKLLQQFVPALASLVVARRQRTDAGPSGCVQPVAEAFGPLGTIAVRAQLGFGQRSEPLSKCSVITQLAGGGRGLTSAHALQIAFPQTPVEPGPCQPLTHALPVVAAQQASEVGQWQRRCAPPQERERGVYQRMTRQGPAAREVVAATAIGATGRQYFRVEPGIGTALDHGPASVQIRNHDADTLRRVLLRQIAGPGQGGLTLVLEARKALRGVKPVAGLRHL